MAAQMRAEGMEEQAVEIEGDTPSTLILTLTLVSIPSRHAAWKVSFLNGGGAQS